MLVDSFVRHANEWLLIGTNNNGNWGWSMWDVDNAYVAAGLQGGIVGLLLLFVLLLEAFRAVGAGLVSHNHRLGGNGLEWCLGVGLFANSVGFLGIVYFDQSAIAWFALLAMIQAIRQTVTAKRFAFSPALAGLGQTR
jgi:hypothetical protein